MKKLIQICSMLGLLVAFSFVSAKAQTTKEYKAQIPFNFNVGQKSYQAGDYTVKVSKMSPGTIALSLQDKEKNNLQTVLVKENGNVAKAEPKLLFDQQDNQTFLTGMLTQDLGISILKPSSKKQSGREIGRPQAKIQGIESAAKM